MRLWSSPSPWCPGEESPIPRYPPSFSGSAAPSAPGSPHSSAPVCRCSGQRARLPPQLAEQALVFRAVEILPALLVDVKPLPGDPRLLHGIELPLLILTLSRHPNISIFHAFRLLLFSSPQFRSMRQRTPCINKPHQMGIGKFHQKPRPKYEFGRGPSIISKPKAPCGTCTARFSRGLFGRGPAG